MKTHKLKILPKYFEKVITEEKTFELRKDDRGFRVDDLIELQEYNKEYTGRSIIARITYKLNGGDYGLEIGYCILGIQLISEYKNDVIDKLKKLVLENYDSNYCGLTQEFSIGNYDDVFADGEDRGMSLVAYEVAKIIGMPVEEPLKQEWSDQMKKVTCNAYLETIKRSENIKDNTLSTKELIELIRLASKDCEGIDGDVLEDILTDEIGRAHV